MDDFISQRAREGGIRPGIVERKRLAACRAAFASAKSPGRRAPSAVEFAEPCILDKSTTRGMLGMGLFVLGFCAVALFVARGGGEDLEAAAVGAAVFDPIGLALVVAAANRFAFREEVEIRGDVLRFRRKSLFVDRGFEESLSEYLCVLPESDYTGGKRESHRLLTLARLVHREDDEKSPALFVSSRDAFDMMGAPSGDRSTFEGLSLSLNLPLASELHGGVFDFRFPDELDKPLADRAARPADPGTAAAGGPGPFPGRRYRVELLPDGFIARRGHAGYWFASAAFAAGAVAAVAFSEGQAGGLGLVLFVFSFFMDAFALTENHLELRGGVLRSWSTLLGNKMGEREVLLSELEELADGTDPSMRCRALVAASDKAVVYWAHRASDAEMAWFKAAIERNLGR